MAHYSITENYAKLLIDMVIKTFLSGWSGGECENMSEFTVSVLSAINMIIAIKSDLVIQTWSSEGCEFVEVLIANWSRQGLLRRLTFTHFHVPHNQKGRTFKLK